MKQWIWILCIFFVGCAVNPAPRIDLSNIHYGCSMDEVRKRLLAVPEIKSVPSLAEEMGIFSMKFIPEANKANFDKEGYEGELKAMPKWSLLLYQGGNESLWFFFDEKNKLMFNGEGDEEVANFKMYMNVVDTFAMMGKLITRAKAETLKYHKYRKLRAMKDNPFMSFFDELWEYKIMLAEKLDKNEITEKEFDYRTTKKQNEMQRNMMADIRSRSRAGLTPSQALAIGLLLSPRPYYVPYSPYYSPYRPYVPYAPYR